MTMPLDVTILIDCEWCERILGDDEDMTPVGSDNLILCRDCYVEDYCEDCRICGNLMEPEEMDRSYIAVMTDVDGRPDDVPAGIYEATSWPYYTQSIIGSGWLWSNALRLIEPLEPFDDGEAPCGYLCAQCLLEAMHGLNSLISKESL